MDKVEDDDFILYKCRNVVADTPAFSTYWIGYQSSEASNFTSATLPDGTPT